MSTIKNAIVAALNDDATFVSYVPGGVFIASRISRDETPTAFDVNSELLPCVMIREEIAIPSGFFDMNWGADSTLVGLWFYENLGSANIEAAAARAKLVLHRQRLPGTTLVTYANELGDMFDDPLEAYLHITRFQVIRRFS